MKPPCKTGAIIKWFVSNLNGGYFSICSLLDWKWFTLPFGCTGRSGAFLNPSSRKKSNYFTHSKWKLEAIFDDRLHR